MDLFGGILGDSNGDEMMARLLKLPCPMCKTQLGLSLTHSPETWALIDKDRKEKR